MRHFTSDLHLFHVNLLRMQPRPFVTIDDFHTAFISNWNSVVKHNDECWVLGDVSFENDKSGVGTAAIFNQLNGKKFLVRGNHDKTLFGTWNREPTPEMRALWAGGIYDMATLKEDHQLIVLLHYKLSTFESSHRGAIQLYGHSHGSSEDNTQQVDVGLDCWNYFPVTLAQAKARMAASKPFHTADRHGKTDY